MQIPSKMGSKFGDLGPPQARSIASPPGWDASPSQVTPQHFVTGTHLYSWMERVTVRVKYLAQEHITITPARA